MSKVSLLEGRLKWRWSLIYAGMSIMTMATLVLELSLTRIFSVVFYYHFAFLAISIALFGLGAGGVFSYLIAARKGSLFTKIGLLAAINAAATVVALAYLLSRSGEMDNWTLAGVYFASALPFFLSGAVISLVIADTIERVDRVYFFDLIGAAGGCLLLVPLLNALGGPNTVIAAAVLFAVSSAIWFTIGGAGWGRVLAVMIALGLTGLVAYNAKYRLIDVRYAKGQTLSDERFVKWNSFSRIAIAPERGTGNLLIFIDADASTGIPRFDFDKLAPREREVLLSGGPSFPYVIRPGAKTLIIGPGGGWDMARALASGSRDVTGVEINPIIANTIMRERFPDLSRRIYFRPEARIFVEDGRSFLRRSQERYQVIQATLVDTWASTAAGAFALSENNLYTVEAFVEYLAHLTPDGVLAFTRWGFDPPRESLRLVTIAEEALRRLGERQPWRHVLVTRENADLISGWGATDTVLIARKPISPAEVERIRFHAAKNRMDAVYIPGDRSGSAFADFLRSKEPSAFLDKYPYDVSAVNDNRPFFFYTVQARDVWEYFTSASKDTADYKVNRAVPLLFGLVFISLAATVIMLALPPLLLRSKLPSEPGLKRFLLYFVCVGVGYILIQVALIQKFVLFLGHPTYALTVIIFSMLISSGAGSYMSRRIGTFSDAPLRKVLIAVAGLIAVLAVIVPPLTEAGVGWPLPVRMLVSVLLIAPAGFAMGMPFPSALSRLEARHKPSVRWAWSLNAASSVLGSAAAIFLALYLGLRETLLIGGTLYLAALIALGYARTGPAATVEARSATT